MFQMNSFICTLSETTIDVVSVVFATLYKVCESVNLGLLSLL